ncbi:MAG: hypothetical protein K2N48_08240 [Muribaculaceae bacterium]|nr:hypothetical protein [Muribaculaceae bacterium]
MKKIIFAGIVCIGLLSACSEEADLPEYGDIRVNPVRAMWPDRPLNVVGESNALKANEFATDLFNKVYAGVPGNTCVSPASVFLTLAMTANGDDGECRDEILDLLGYEEGADALHELNAYCNALLVEVPDLSGDTQCGFTNSLWHSPDFNLLPSFTDSMKGIFGAADVDIWLGDEKGRTAVNRFVEENTRGMIKDFLKEPQHIDLGILNTTYFKGTWKQKFNEKNTSKGNFRNLDGSRVKTRFMALTDMMAYYCNDIATAVRLPYAGDRYMMTLIMPDEGLEFNDMLRKLDGKLINDIASNLRSGKVELKLPKFAFENNSNIIKILQEMGLDRTCFPGIRNAAADPLELKVFQHAVKITVDEKGTEGGAASLGGFLGTSVATTETTPVEPISFDRPFVYIICDTVSGTILFMGAVVSF